MQNNPSLEPAPQTSSQKFPRSCQISQPVMNKIPDWNNFGSELYNSGRDFENQDDDVDSDLVDNLSNCAMPEESLLKVRENKNQSRTIVSWYKKIRKNAKKETKLKIKNINFACKYGMPLYKGMSPFTMIRVGDGNYLPVDPSVLNTKVDSREYFTLASGIAENKRILTIDN
jgi:hypothetical protein